MYLFLASRERQLYGEWLQHPTGSYWPKHVLDDQPGRPFCWIPDTCFSWIDQS
jgi:hypothetical protein